MCGRNLRNMREVTMGRAHRTNNISDALENAFSALVGQKRPMVWRSIGGFGKDFAMDEAAVIHRDQDQRHPEKVKRPLVEYERGEREGYGDVHPRSCKGDEGLTRVASDI